jgi:hypothetical protein
MSAHAVADGQRDAERRLEREHRVFVDLLFRIAPRVAQLRLVDDDASGRAQHQRSPTAVAR